MNRRLKICRVATVPFALLGSRDHLEKIQELGCDLTVVCSSGKSFEKIKKLKVSRVEAIEIPREISPFKDIKAIIKLVSFFRHNQFDLIHSNTPKGGLLVAIAGFLARTAPVLHTYTGQRWSTLRGLKRGLLYFCDWLIFQLNAKCLTDSHSQKEFLISKGIGHHKGLECIHQGAFAGINTKRFTTLSDSEKDDILAELGFQKRDFILLFVGRIVGDKGIIELVEAFQELNLQNNRLKLLLVGPVELAGDPLPQRILDAIQSNSSIVSTGLQLNPEKYMNVASVFCLPSYREGFPTVVLEAATLKVPSIVTNIVGGRDTVVDNETGLLIEPKSKNLLKEAILALFKDEKRTKDLGEKAWQRVMRDFTLEIIAEKNLEKYQEIVDEKTP